MLGKNGNHKIKPWMNAALPVWQDVNENDSVIRLDTHACKDPVHKSRMQRNPLPRPRKQLQTSGKHWLKICTGLNSKNLQQEKFWPKYSMSCCSVRWEGPGLVASSNPIRSAILIKGNGPTRPVFTAADSEKGVSLLKLEWVQPRICWVGLRESLAVLSGLVNTKPMLEPKFRLFFRRLLSRMCWCFTRAGRVVWDCKTGHWTQPKYVELIVSTCDIATIAAFNREPLAGHTVVSMRHTPYL